MRITVFLLALFFFSTPFSTLHAGPVSSLAPGYARFITDEGYLTDTFDGPESLEAYHLYNMGVAFVDGEFQSVLPGGYGTISVDPELGRLVLDTGTIESSSEEFELSGVLALSKVTFANQSFKASIQISLEPGSTGISSAGLGIFPGDWDSPDDAIGLALSQSATMNSSGEPDTVINLSDPFSGVIPIQGVYVPGTFLTFEIDYDAQSQIVIFRCAELNVTRLHSMNFSTFIIGMKSAAAHIPGLFPDDTRSVFHFDNLETDLLLGPDVSEGQYNVSYTPLVYEGLVYDDDISGGDAAQTYWLLDQGFFAVSANDRQLLLDGVKNVNAALLDVGGLKVTLYTTFTLDELGATPSDTQLIAWEPHVYLAKGFGENYVFNLSQRKKVSPFPTSCGLACGQGGCSAPLPGTGNDSSINLASGNLYHHATILSGTPHEAGPQLSYNGKNGASTLGAGWSHAAMSKIHFSAAGDIVLLTSTGGEISFTPLGDGSYRVVEGCCSADYLKAVSSATEIKVMRRGGKSAVYPVQGGAIASAVDLNGLAWSYGYNQDGTVTTTTDPYGRSYAFSYDATGHMTQITDPMGNNTEFEIQDGKLLQVTDARGATERYQYNAAGLLTKVVDKAGFIWKYAYDDQGRAVAVTDAAGKETRITYLDGFNFAYVTDRRGASTLYEFDPNLNVITRIVDPLGRQTFQGYDAQGNVVSRTDPAGFTTQTEYDLINHLPTRQIDAVGGVKTMTYNALGQMTSERDPNGNLTQMTYDANGNLATKTDALGNTETNAYDAEGNRTSHTNRAGEITTYQYLNGVLVSSTDGAGVTTTFENDGLGRTTASIDGAGNRREIVRDELGNETGTKFPDGLEVTRVLDGLGREIGVDAPSEPNQAAVFKAYDHNGLITAATTFLGFSSQRGYDEAGNQVTEVSSAGRERSFAYDEAGQNVLTVDGDGIQQIAQYDARGQYSRITDANQADTNFQYDGLNRLVNLAIDDHVTTYNQDLNGNLLSESTNGRITTNVYDALNRRVSTTDPMGNTTTFEYDLEGRLIKQTDPLGRITSHTFDIAGRNLSTTRPDGGVFSWEYESRGLKSAETDALGHRTQFVYDERGRLIESIDPLGGRWKKEYDSASRVVAEENPMGERATHEYDADGRVIRSTDPLGRAKQFVYDADGNQIAMIEPDGTVRTKAYNTKNNVIAEEAIAGDPSTRVQYVRDVAGKIVRYIDERGNPRSYAYNVKGELTVITDALGNEVKFTRNADGDVTHKSYTEAGAIDYVFDLSRRLVEKRLSQAAITETSFFTYDGANQLIERRAFVGGQFVSYDYGYDLAGRESQYHMTPGDESYYEYDREGSRTALVMPGIGYRVDYQYDANHRPVRMATNEGEVWFFNYDAANRRTSVVYPDGSVKFTFYDLAGQIIEEWARDMAGVTIFREQNTFDLRGNIAAALTPTESRVYTYNGRDWLTSMRVTSLVNGARYEQLLSYDAAGNMTRQILRSLDGDKLPFTEIFPSEDGSPDLSRNLDSSYFYDAGDRLVQETVITARGDIYQIAYDWDGAGNMRQKVVTGPRGDTDTEFHWTAENRLTRVDGDSSTFNNLPLLEGEGKDQNTWATLRSSPYDQNREERLAYDHLGRHILARQRPSDGLLHETYVVGPNRDELLAYKKNAGSNTSDRAYVYGNFRNDVLAVRSADDPQLAEDRTYLPTGVALSTTRQNVKKGPPRNAPLPENFPSDTLRRPLMFGWQGKPLMLSAARDWNNRAYGNQFYSRDPLTENPEQGGSASILDANNSLRFVDPTGLYVLDTVTCSGYASKTYASMTAVKYATHRDTLTTAGNCIHTAGLRLCMKTRFATSIIHCYGGKGSRGAAWPTVIVQSLLLLGGYASGGLVGNIFINPILMNKQEMSVHGVNYSAMPYSGTLLHEMVHTCGFWTECTPNACQYSCKQNVRPQPTSSSPCWMSKSLCY